MYTTATAPSFTYRCARRESLAETREANPDVEFTLYKKYLSAKHHHRRRLVAAFRKWRAAL